MRGSWGRATDAGGCGHAGDHSPSARARRAAREPGAPSPSSGLLHDAVGGAGDARGVDPAPPFDASAMDGWAVSGPGPWTVVGSVLAGEQLERLPTAQPSRSRRVPRCRRAPTPSCAASAGSSSTTRTARPSTSATTRPADRSTPRVRRTRQRHPAARPGVGRRRAPARGRRCRHSRGRGHGRGRRLRRAAVVRPPDVALLVLGDELLLRGSPRDGRVRDALGPMLPSWIAWAGGRAFPPHPRARHPRRPAAGARRRQRRRRRHHRLDRRRPCRPPAPRSTGSARTGSSTASPYDRARRCASRPCPTVATSSVCPATRSPRCRRSSRSSHPARLAARRGGRRRGSRSRRPCSRRRSGATPTTCGSSRAPRARRPRHDRDADAVHRPRDAARSRRRRRRRRDPSGRRAARASVRVPALP